MRLILDIEVGTSGEVQPNRNKRAMTLSVSLAFYHITLKQNYRDFLRGLVVKNLPCNAGDTGSIPGLGRPHMPQSD